jgi:GTPase SAR1 family protein
VKYWVEELRAKRPSNVVIAVAGNKSDQPAEKKMVDPAVAKAYCDENGMLFFETSALSGDNVSQLFESTSVRVMNQSRGLK